ncbi:MAG: 16S rRNA (cytidine(1402)-2'-O)-methyltransferase [Desulfovibrionaceae bacterium]|nr:16S rRNA (cytidine(1402)-2'-O)-methyltransferase [Desulfovibrionaceae bacterium]
MSSVSSPPAGELLLVSTPLGNPGDLSPRAKEALSRADAVLAEDTRRTGLLLAGCGISARRLISFHEHNEDERLPGLLEELAQGRRLALVSDAGTPLLADPGYALTRACRDAGFKITALPGPCAAIAALSASGLPPQPFAFLGFPPRRPGDRRRFFAPFAALQLTLVFYERKDRIRQALETLLDLGGPREICLARELTKVHEEFIFFTLGEWERLPGDLLGEITAVAGPPFSQKRLTEEEVRARIAALRRQNPDTLKPRDLLRQIRTQAPGWNATEIYRLLR